MSQPPNRFCGACGTAVPSASRFCSACGIELATFESVTTGEPSDSSGATTSTPTPSLETQTPNPTTSTHSPRWPFSRWPFSRWPFSRWPFSRWTFSRRITVLLGLLVVAIAVVSTGLTIALNNQSSIGFATNVNIVHMVDEGRIAGRIADDHSVGKNAWRARLAKRLHHSWFPIRRHLGGARGRLAAGHVNLICKHQRGYLCHRYGPSGRTLPDR